MLTLLTATGMRQKAWDTCQHLMMRQTYAGDVHWIIVDDGADKQKISFDRLNWGLTVVRPTKLWKPGNNSQCSNLLAGLNVVCPDDRLVIIEDDDYYSSEYLSSIDEWLNGADLVGESHAKYYNVKSKVYADLKNENHASLCSTAMKGEAIDFFIEVVKQQSMQAKPFIDLSLWKRFEGSKSLHNAGLVVGIKGLPGRPGIGAGHRMNGSQDLSLEKAKEWLGNDWGLYFE